MKTNKKPPQKNSGSKGNALALALSKPPRKK
jgi:hypothetical protein